MYNNISSQKWYAFSVDAVCNFRVLCVQINRSALSHASEKGHLAIVRYMVRSFGCSVEERSKVRLRTAIVKYSRIECLHSLLGCECLYICM